MEFIELTANDYILKFNLNDIDQGYKYTREIFNQICRKYPNKTFVALPTEVDILQMTEEELELVKGRIEEILEEMKMKKESESL